MATVNVTNGVNVNQLVETINAVKQDPRLARFQFRASSRWEGGGRCVSTVESLYGAGSEHQHIELHTLHGDEPAVLLGSDTGPNAVETVLAALASCLAVGFAYNAAAQGIEIEEMTFDLDGDLDLHAFLGLGDTPRAGYENIWVRCRIKSSAGPEQIAALSEYVQRTSPVLDIIRNPVPVSVEIADSKA